jgi:hypothetical protein
MRQTDVEPWVRVCYLSPPANMNGIPLEHLNLETWTKLVDAHFRVHAGGSSPVLVKLAQVVSGPVRSRGDQRTESFSVLFLGPTDRILPQQIYRFEQDQLGSFELFLVPVGRRADALEYEAVFNRFVKPG